MPDLSERTTEAELIDNPLAVTAQEMEQVLRELEAGQPLAGRDFHQLEGGWPFLEQVDRAGPHPDRGLRHRSGRHSTRPGSMVSPAQSSREDRRDRLQPGSLPAGSPARGWFSGDRCGQGRRPSAPPLASRSTDLILCSAFLHHFSDRQLIEIISGLRECATTAIVINDLQRHRVAYWSIRLLTRLFSRSQAVRHDGPLSVRKGFHRRELIRLLKSAGCRDFEIRWRWAFRWLVIVRP